MYCCTVDLHKTQLENKHSNIIVWFLCLNLKQLLIFIFGGKKNCQLETNLAYLKGDNKIMNSSVKIKISLPKIFKTLKTHKSLVYFVETVEWKQDDVSTEIHGSCTYMLQTASNFNPTKRTITSEALQKLSEILMKSLYGKRQYSHTVYKEFSFWLEPPYLLLFYLSNYRWSWVMTL